MLKKYINGVLLAPGVNDDAGSPDASDVTADSSSENTESKQGSETEKDVKQPTLEEVAMAAFKKSTEGENQEESSAKEKPEDGEILQSNQTDKKEDKEESSEADKNEDKKENEGDEEKGKKHEDSVPYERFQEAVKSKQEYENKIKEYEPLVEAHKSIVEYCQTNQITEDQFRQGMEVLKLVNTDPIAARKALEPIWNQLNGLAGETLPEDLAKEVEEGTISEKRAKEIAGLRGQSQIQQARKQLDGQQMQKQQQAALQQEIARSINSWATNKQATDTAFKPKVSANAADGKFEFVADRFYKLLSTNPPRNAADALKLVEQAYTDVTKVFETMKPKVPLSHKNVSSTKSSSNSKQEPKSIKDVVANVLAAHKA